jgi:hypothetical protein
MAAPSKRETVLPHSLWDNEGEVPHRNPGTDWSKGEEMSEVPHVCSMSEKAKIVYFSLKP